MSLIVWVCGCSGPTSSPPARIRLGGDLQSQLDAQRAYAVGFSRFCPSGWELRPKGGDFDFAAVPIGTAAAAIDPPLLEIEVPNLPPHIPGFIPLGGVASGYVQDLKKRYPDQKVDEQSTVKVDGTDARRIVSSFQNKGKPWRELAVLAVHGDHVYVITGNCDASAFDKTRTALDALVASVKWTTKS